MTGKSHLLIGRNYSDYTLKRKGRNHMKKNLGRTLLMAALALSIVLSVTGGTIAWFTDSVESAGNKIEAGNLSIDILLKEGNDWISLKEKPETKVFDYNLWEPGFTQYEALTIKNTGNLALKYELHVIPGEDEVKNNDGESLAEAIDVYMAFGAQAPLPLRRSPHPLPGGIAAPWLI